MFVFGSFRLDVANASLKRGKQAIVLTPKALNVLHYLVEHAGPSWLQKMTSGGRFGPASVSQMPRLPCV